jgi:CRP/FNR family cyclic AMP-dependent transcriptional regulator
MTNNLPQGSYDMLPWMAPETRAAFLAAVRCRHYRAGQLLYMEGDAGTEMYRIRRGAARLSLTRFDGRQFVLAHLTGGDCFGDSSMVDGGLRPQTAQASEDSDVQVLDKEAFDRLRQDHRSFGDAVMRLLARQMRLAASHYANRNLDSLEARVISQLSTLARGVTGSNSVPVSQAELGLLVGASRQHVNRIIKSLERRGVISTGYGRIVIVDRGELGRLADENGRQGDRPSEPAGA